MKTLLLKEIRLLLPIWGVALLLAVVPVWLAGLRADPGGTALLWFGGGVVLLSVAPFGLEFSNGTFQLLLTLPLPRRRIWLVKVFVLTVALSGILGCFWLSLRCRMTGTRFEPHLASLFDFAGMLVLLGLAGGLWTTLLLRQIAAAIWFTPLVPGFLALLVLDLPVEPATVANVAQTVAVLIGYAVLGILWAAWLFAGAQDAQWTGGTVSLSLHWLWPARTQAGSQTRPRSAWLALLSKELHLQQTGLLLAGAAVVCHVAASMICAVVGRPVSTQAYDLLKYQYVLVCFVWYVVPVMFGAMAVAEERKLGTLEGQFCLPATRRTQFFLKFAVVLFLSVVFAGLLRWGLEQLGIRVTVPGEIGTSLRGWRDLLELIATISCVAAISFYASTMARNTLQALGIAVVLGVAGAFVAELAAHPGYRLGIPVWDGPLIKYVAWPVMVTTACMLACSNFKRFHGVGRTLVRDLLVLIGAIFFVTAVTAFTYHRAWEFVMSLEPSHSPARISPSGRTKLYVFPGKDKWLVLLPDGRLWASHDYLGGEMTGFKHWKRRPPQSSSGFLPGSDWVVVAASLQEAVAIKTDGSLRTLFRYQRGQASELALSCFDSDTNWVDLAGGPHHFLGVKRDGTLWGWGDNSQAQLATNLPKTNQAPVRIGGDTDWGACFTHWGTSIGVRRDGTVWRWGGWEYGTNHTWALVLPTRVNLPGTGLKAIGRGPDGGWIGSYEDGRLMYSGPERPGTASEARPFPGPYRVGAAADWSDISCNGMDFVGLKRDGSFWKAKATMNSVGAWSFDLSPAIRAGKYSDWIAVSAGLGNRMTLAADGTLCAWPLGYQQHGDLLRPTRRYIGSVNIFDAPTTLTHAKP